MNRIDTSLEALLGQLSKSHLASVLIILGLALALTLPGQSSMPVTDRDEARFVQASKQMLESGDYIDIRNQDQPRWKKPVGIYWLQAAAAHITGFKENAEIWVYRIPSALGIITAALLTYWAFLPLFSRPASLIAGLVVASTITTGVEANIAKTDAVLLATIVLAQGALIRLYLPAERIRRFGKDHWLLWLGLGLGFLVKGPIVLIPTLATLLWISVFDQAWYMWRAIIPMRGLLVFACVAAPWYIAIAIQSQGAFFAESLGKDLLGKVGNAAEKHWGPPGYYLATIWVSFWPWVPLALLAVPLAWAERSTPQMKFIAGWVIPHWLLFAMLSTKLPHYVLPVLPAVAGLIGHWVTSTKSTAGKKLKSLSTVLFILGAVLASVFAFLPLPYYELSFPPLLAVFAVLILVLVFLAAVALANDQAYAFAGFGVAGVLLMLPALTTITAPRTDDLFLSPRLAAIHEKFNDCAGQTLLSHGYQEMSLVFLTETETRFVSRDALAKTIAENPNGRGLIRLTDENALSEIARKSGHELEVYASITGTNYNSGKEVTIALIGRKDAPDLGKCAEGAPREGT